MADPVVRIAARGDGVTQDGRHVPFGVPGDVLEDDGTVLPGPHRQVPPCRHFPECGGCQLQHADDPALAEFVQSRILFALKQHGIDASMRPVHLSPPRSRRRATVRVLNTGRTAIAGFHGERTNRIVDMQECHVLRPELFALVSPLRDLLGKPAAAGKAFECMMTLVDQGVDLLVRGPLPDDLDVLERLGRFALDHKLARLAVDRGLGGDILFEPAPATVTLSGRPVAFPVAGFLQATADGEAALVAAVRHFAEGARACADLFSGIGTFALALPGRVYAAEAARDAVAALARAAPAIAADHRDLYRRPLSREELDRFDCVVLDPPRGGAEAQARTLAASRVPRVAYVSCNPATFARDARILTEGGMRLAAVTPVGQFRWSTHVELVAEFVR